MHIEDNNVQIEDNNNVQIEDNNVQIEDSPHALEDSAMQNEQNLEGMTETDEPIEDVDANLLKKKKT